jgi:tRNA threonylcarbamoyladenosine biosynthesis protein TsaB
VIIAIETASTDVSLALARPDGTTIASTAWTGDRRQGHETLPRLLALLRDNHAALGDATALAVGIGPGSFTGLRVGMSLAKGMALSLARPIVGVPSLMAWLVAEPDADGALARAGARDAYLLLRGEDAAHVVDRDELPHAARGAALVAPQELAQAFGLGGARPPERAAASVAALAAERLRAKPGGDDLDLLEPAYLRAPRGLERVSGGKPG